MARWSGLWNKIEDVLKPAVGSGVNILIVGLNKYINFNAVSGEDGYGIRDNNGTLQFKNENGTWVNLGSDGGGGSGDVVGPASSTDNHIAVFNGTTGKIIKDSGVTTASFATSAQGAKADSAVQPADLGAAAISNDYNDLDNLPDLSAFDNISEHATFSAFPATGVSDKFYLAQDTGILYRWAGSAYVVISAQLALGETSDTAYRGDRGKIAYDHAQQTGGNPHNVTKSEIGLGNVDNTSDADKPISTATQTALDAKAPLNSPTFTGNTTVADLQVTGEFGADAEVDNENSGTAATINWTAGNFQKSTMTGNVTYTFTAPTYVGRYQLMLVQDATGSRTATWPASVKWPSGTAPTLSTAANAIDIISFYFDGTNYYGVDSLNFS